MKIVSALEATLYGKRLLETCRSVRLEDKQRGRDPKDPEIGKWLSAQVGSFAVYIAAIAEQHGRRHVLVQRMIDESEAIMSYIMSRMIDPNPTE